MRKRRGGKEKERKRRTEVRISFSMTCFSVRGGSISSSSRAASGEGIYSRLVELMVGRSE